MILFRGAWQHADTAAEAVPQVNVIKSRKREHSRKRADNTTFIERCSPAPYLEMFARHSRPGWSVWGDEAAPQVTPRGRVHQGYEGGPIEHISPLHSPSPTTGSSRYHRAVWRGADDQGANVHRPEARTRSTTQLWV